MFCLRKGASPKRSVPPGLVAMVMLCAFPLASCSTSRAPASPAVYSWSRSEPPSYAAAPVRREIEDDGIEAQLPPTRRIRSITDDPTQPWSRNYGRSPAAVSASDVYRGETGEAAPGNRGAHSADGTMAAVAE